MTKKNNHRWNTQHYVNYTDFLDRTELNKLYPSESWSLYRLLKNSKTVIDLGCGNGAMSSISNKINDKIKYLGVDHQEFLISRAKSKYKESSFIFSDLNNFIHINEKKFDTVMAWSVIKSFKNWKKIILSMINISKKYVVFDQRVTDSDIVKFDKKVLSATYGGIEGPLLCIGYKNLKNFLLKNSKNFKKIELMAYESSWGQNIKYKLKDRTFVVTVVLHVKKKSSEKFDGIYEQLPVNLKIN